MLALVFIYSGEFAERVIRNLVNDPSFCKSCGLYCDSCKYNVYSYVNNIRAAVELQSPLELPAFIDNPEEYLPRKIPKADICIASGLHKDLLLELPQQLQKSDIKGLVVPIEDYAEVPPGLRKQVEEKCQDFGLECAFPKPFCSLEPSRDKPITSALAIELEIGRPWLEVSTAKRGRHEVVHSTFVRRSAPCGSSWYIARKLIGVQAKREILYDAIAKAHHSYPCTATMNVDPEAKEPILHIGGHIIRDEVEKAMERACSESTEKYRGQKRSLEK